MGPEVSNSTSEVPAVLNGDTRTHRCRAVVLIELIHVKYLEQHLTQNFHLINVIVILITAPFHYLDAFKSIESFK